MRHLMQKIKDINISWQDRNTSIKHSMAPSSSCPAWSSQWCHPLDSPFILSHHIHYSFKIENMFFSSKLSTSIENNTLIIDIRSLVNFSPLSIFLNFGSLWPPQNPNMRYMWCHHLNIPTMVMLIQQCLWCLSMFDFIKAETRWTVCPCLSHNSPWLR